MSTLGSCAQKNQTKTANKKIMMPIPQESKDITVDNFVEKVVSQIKHYEKEPMYFIRPLQNNCVYELLVNDYLIYQDYGIEKLGTPININRAILQSGPQTVTVRLYPLGDAMKRAYGTKETVTTLLDKTEMNISVVKYDAFNISQDLEDEILVKEHKAPTIEGTNAFLGAGLPYFEYTFSFDAKVPYVNEGWTNGEDLTKFDKEELEKQILKCYNEYIYIYKNKELDTLLKMIYLSEIRRRQAQYQNREKVKRVLDESKESLNYKNKEFQPLENYIINFYGNNKIVSLRHPSKEPVDHRLRGWSAFWFKYQKGNRIKGYYPGLYLYLPKGQPLDSLQMIR